MTKYVSRVQEIDAIQFTGDNAQEVVDWVGQNGEVIDGAPVFQNFDSTLEVPVGSFLSPNIDPSYPESGPFSWTEEEFLAAYQLSVPVLQTANGQGSNATSITAGGTQTIVVTLSKPMPTATYQVVPSIQSLYPSLLGTVSIMVGSRTKTTVSVVVKNSGSASLAANALTVGVIAIG